MEISFNGDPNRLVIRLTGDLDRAGLETLRQAMQRIDLCAYRELQLDLSGLGFIGTSGIAFLLETAREQAALERKFQVIRTPAQIRELIDSLHLEKVLSYS